MSSMSNAGIAQRMTSVQHKVCIQITEKIMNLPIAGHFSKPVNPELDGAPDYFEIIKKPMDLSLVLRKLKEDQYQTVEKWKEDMNQIWKNATQYNDATRPIHAIARELNEYFRRQCLENIPKNEVELWISRVNKKHTKLMRILEAKPDPKKVMLDAKPKSARPTKILLRQKSSGNIGPN